MRRATLGLLLALGAAVAAGAAPTPQIIVSAAASLTDVLTELQPRAEAFTGARIVYNFGGSGTLRQQIEQGAPVDVIFSAAASDMDRLQAEGLVLPETRRDILANAIVLVGGKGTAAVRGADELRTMLSGAEFLAIGNPDSVPAGRYAVQALASLGLYDLVEKKLVLGNTVREVLQFVQSGSAPLGIVFVTDALAVPGDVKQLFTFPGSSLATPILYPAAVIRASRNQDAARRMMDFLKSEPARDAFTRAGFVVK